LEKQGQDLTELKENDQVESGNASEIVDSFEQEIEKVKEQLRRKNSEEVNAFMQEEEKQIQTQLEKTTSLSGEAD